MTAPLKHLHSPLAWDKMSRGDLIEVLHKLGYTYETVLRLRDLTEEEVKFVKLVGQRNGSKLATHECYSQHVFEALWNAPTRLGLIHAVGSYKWLPGPDPTATPEEVAAAAAPVAVSSGDYPAVGTPVFASLYRQFPFLTTISAYVWDERFSPLGAVGEPNAFVYTFADGKSNVAVLREATFYKDFPADTPFLYTVFVDDDMENRQVEDYFCRAEDAWGRVIDIVNGVRKPNVRVGHKMTKDDFVVELTPVKTS